MQLNIPSLMALLCVSTALAADAGLLSGCGSSDGGKACKKCIFNDAKLANVCYAGTCGLKNSGRRASGVHPPPQRL
jgi:hypothetical protein